MSIKQLAKEAAETINKMLAGVENPNIRVISTSSKLKALKLATELTGQLKAELMFECSTEDLLFIPVGRGVNKRLIHMEVSVGHTNENGLSARVVKSTVGYVGYRLVYSIHYGETGKTISYCASDPALPKTQNRSVSDGFAALAAVVKCVAQHKKAKEENMKTDQPTQEQAVQPVDDSLDRLVQKARDRQSVSALLIVNSASSVLDELNRAQFGTGPFKGLFELYCFLMELQDDAVVKYSRSPLVDLEAFSFTEYERNAIICYTTPFWFGNSASTQEPHMTSLIPSAALNSTGAFGSLKLLTRCLVHGFFYGRDLVEAAHKELKSATIDTREVSLECVGDLIDMTEYILSSRPLLEEFKQKYVFLAVKVAFSKDMTTTPAPVDTKVEPTPSPEAPVKDLADVSTAELKKALKDRIGADRNRVLAQKQCVYSLLCELRNNFVWPSFIEQAKNVCEAKLDVEEKDPFANNCSYAMRVCVILNLQVCNRSKVEEALVDWICYLEGLMARFSLE